MTDDRLDAYASFVAVAVIAAAFMVARIHHLLHPHL